MATLASTPTARPSTSLSSWMRDTQGSVSVEFVIGAVLIVTTTVGGMDLYRVIDGQLLSLRAASTVAEYVSLEPAPNAMFIEDLAKFSYRNEVALPADAVFIVSAVGRSSATPTEPDPPDVVQWTRAFAVGEDPASPPHDLTVSCGQLGDSGDVDPAMLTALGMEPGDMVVVVEVCLRLLPRAFVSGGLLAGNVFPALSYQHRILPVRGETMPEEPA